MAHSNRQSSAARFSGTISDPFFIVCDARSGSTFLANQLVSKFGLAVTPETNFIPRLINRFESNSVGSFTDVDKMLDIMFSDAKFSDLELTRDRIAGRLRNQLPMSLGEAIRVVLTLYKDTHQPTSPICGIKKGSYVDCLDGLLEIFPQARIIGLIRDGRAVFRSKKTSLYSKTGRPFETDPSRAAGDWKSKVTRLRRLEEDYENVLVIHYETLITELDVVLEDLAMFLGVNRKALQVSENTYKVGARYDKKLHANINKKPLINRISAWRKELSRSEIEAFEAIAAQELLQEGYVLESRGDVKGHSS